MIFEHLRYAIYRWVRWPIPLRASLHFFNHSHLSQSKRMRILRRGFRGVSKRATIAAPLVIESIDFAVGRDSFVNAGCIVLNAARVQIGDGTLIGPAVSLCTTYHHADPRDRARDRQAFNNAITIGNNVWIGAGATICPGVTIGDDAVVAAGAVVTTDVPSGTMVAGVPATIKKEWPLASGSRLDEYQADARAI